MNETIFEVVSQLVEAHPQYKKAYIPVAARVHGNFDGIEDTYWFLVGQMNKSMYEHEELKRFGHLVSRNSYIATRILNEEIGTELEYTLKNRIKRMVQHHVCATSKADLGNHTIYVLDDTREYSYDDIQLFLKALQSKQREIEENERKQREQELQREQAKTAHEKGVITKNINRLQEEKRILTLQQEEMTKLTRYIRKQGQLRFNPILDPVQNRIKTKNLFDGTTVIIDGGPGTGKTTTMIQRLKYLTDWDAIEKDFFEETNLYGLSVSQRDRLHQAIDNNQDWMFFSPSALLKEYLTFAMDKEGLTNIRSKVWHWDEYRRKAIRENYMLIDPNDDNAPFKMGRSNEILIIDGQGAINGFETFFLNQLRQIRRLFPKLEDNGSNYRWMTLARNIQKRFDDCDSMSLLQFIQLFNSLEQVYGQDCRELLNENRSRVRKIADEIHALCMDKIEVYEQLEQMVKAQPAAEQAEEIEDEQDMSEEAEEIVEDLTQKITGMIRTWFKRYCYKQKNTEIKLTSRQEVLNSLLLPILTKDHQDQMDKVGELALFEQFAKYTRGVISNVFGNFAAKYKRFRRLILSNKTGGWNHEELQAMLQRREGKELHPQEQALLIGFINNLVRQVLRVVHQPINHVFVKAYQELSRPIIGIDEATDFSVCDIYAMESLLTTDFNSLTICGDMMQRLTKEGITSWEDIEPLVLGYKVVEMNTSYRQSARLLQVAKELYYDSIGVEPKYKAYMPSTKVPKPLAFVSENEQQKIAWIEKRIREVYNAYGKKLPSIAIFLNKKEDIPSFVESLKDTDFMYDAGVDIVDGSAGNVLASENQIRVYPINVVKGMEFDVVFFHNIDCMANTNDLIKRYIYVGVSRAAFFLGITLNSENKELCRYFDKDSSWEKV